MTLRDSPQNSAGKKGSDGPNKVVKLTSCAEESFPSGSVVKNSPAKQEMWVRSLGQADPLEKVIATHSNILAWEIPWTEEAGGLQPRGGRRVGHDWLNSVCWREGASHRKFFSLKIWRHGIRLCAKSGVQRPLSCTVRVPSGGHCAQSQCSSLEPAFMI